MSDTLSTNLDLFIAGSRREIFAAREALLNSDFGGLSAIMERMESSKPVQNITNVATTSSASLDRLVETFHQATPGLKVVAGLSVVGAGAILWGAGFALAPIIAVCLIALGISIALPAALEIIENRFNDWYDKLDI